jgi:sugar phosphate isomerase/epimerase
MLAMTTDYHGVSKNTANIKEALANIARAGFSHIHWCHEWTGDYLYSVHEMLQVREWCGEFGLKVKGVHATDGVKRQPFNPADPRDLFVQNTKDYTSLNEYNRLAGVELIKNRIDLARILDAGAIVLHFPQPYEVFEADKNYREQYYCQAFKSFDELEYYCKTRCIRICVENLGSPPEYLRYEFDTLFERYDSAYMGLCFDTGHGNFTCKNNSLEFAERCNDRLFMIHVHDNQGEKDEHLIPFEGTFNWEGFAEVLARSPYEFPILMEPSYKEDKDDAVWLDKAFKAGMRFHEMVIKHRT